MEGGKNFPAAETNERPHEARQLPNRPITLLSATSKVFETLILPEFKKHITPRTEQFGFRSGHSTSMQLSRVIHFLASATNKKECAVATFLDMEKAFDRVWHEGLLYKLHDNGLTRRLIHVIASFLTDRTFDVREGSTTSSTRQIKAGVPYHRAAACRPHYTWPTQMIYQYTQHPSWPSLLTTSR